MQVNLLNDRKNVFSQNGEDGVIEEIYNHIGEGSKVCCEFGAWDGVHFCNIRQLILNRGWTGIMIEGEPERCNRIKENYPDSSVYVINSFVDAKRNALHSLLKQQVEPMHHEIDLLSIDIDGLDYEILESLEVKPRVICIEVNAGHYPATAKRIRRGIAKRNIGQPLGVFSEIAFGKGYSLVAYTGNAFYVRQDVLRGCSLEAIADEVAYDAFLGCLSVEERQWLYMVNLGRVAPYFPFRNEKLTALKLGLGVAQVQEMEQKFPDGIKVRVKRTLNQIFS